MELPHEQTEVTRRPFAEQLHDFITRPLVAGLLILIVGLATLALAFHLEENWRGKRAWAKAKRDLESRGAVLDWKTLIPKQVPDAENFFKAPHMTDWFVKGQSNTLGKKFGTQTLLKSMRQRPSYPLLTVVTAPPEEPTPERDSEVLDYMAPVLTYKSTENPASNAAIPLLVLDSVPLQIAITNLARQAGIEFRLGPYLFEDKAGHPQHDPEVSIRWENLTAEEALYALLSNYNLLMERRAPGQPFLIRAKSADELPIIIDRSARDALWKFLHRDAAERSAPENPQLMGAQGFLLALHPWQTNAPKTLYVRTRSHLTANDVENFFPGGIVPFNRIRALNSPSNSFNLYPMTPSYYVAADYISGTEPLEEDFETIREALKRPHARFDGDYLRPFDLPMLNFVFMRQLAQLLSQRSQCFLLLQQPEKALRDLTLIHEAQRLLKPEPVTLVAAMINVAITGLYVSTVADGLRLHAWQEPQLKEIQQQLQELDLPAQVNAALVTERSSVCYFLEHCTYDEFTRIFGPNSQTTWWQRMQDPKTLLLSTMPAGWKYQNMARVALLNEKQSQIYDSQRHVMQTAKQSEVDAEIQSGLSPSSPYSFLAAVSVPNFRRALQTMARNQTQASQAIIACALERYQMKYHSLPKTLDALLPDFAPTLPRDLIDGKPLHYQLTKEANYLLYSVGWNGIDEGGEESRDQLQSGDWVWER